MLGLVVFGSRTWMCTIAAPALAASSAEVAICSGVTGTAGLRPGVSAEPVTAQEMITLRCIASPHTVQVDAFGRNRELRLDLRGSYSGRIGGCPAIGRTKTNDHERGARVHPASPDLT